MRKVEIEHPFLLSSGLLLALFLDGTGIFRYSVAAVILHESAHVLAYLLLFHQFPQLRISAGGISLSVKTPRCPAWKETLVLVAGPLANFLAAAICLGSAAHTARVAWYLCGAVNLILGVFNLLPMGFLDGGRLLEHLLLQFVSLRTAWKINYVLEILGLILIVLFLFASSTDWITKLTLLCFLGYYVFKSFCGKN